MSGIGKIDPAILGSKTHLGTYTFDSKGFILYALGIGFSQDPNNTNDLKYTFELNKNFATFPTIASCFGQTKQLENISTNKYLPKFPFNNVLHAEEKLTMVHRALKVGGKYEVQTEVIDLLDKGQGKGTFLIQRFSGYLVNEKGERDLAYYIDKNTMIRKMGGSGIKPTGKSKPIPNPPKRDVDREWTDKTFPNQAILYRLVSDPNPLHIDHEFAKVGGFPKPIIHGLATYGTIVRSIVQNWLNNDAELLQSVEIRFTGHVFPGESLKIKTWKDGNRLFFETWVVERNTKAAIGVIGVREGAKL